MTSESPRRRKPGCALRCLGVGCIGVLVALASVYGLFLYNNRPPSIVIPTTPMPADNAYEDINRAAAMLTGRVHVFPIDLYPVPPNYGIADYRAAYLEAFPAIELLRKNLQRPYQRPPRRSFRTFVSGAGLREMARTLSGAAEYQAKVGHQEVAAVLLLDGIELGARTPKGGAIIDTLVGEAVQYICSVPLEPLLPKLRPDDLALAAARLDRIAGERVSFSDLVLEQGRRETAGWLEEVRAPRSVVALHQFMRAQFDMPYNREGRMASEWHALRFTLENKDAALRAYLQWTVTLSRSSTGSYTGALPLPVPYDFMTSYPDMYLQARRNIAASESVQNLLRLEVALLRYHADRHRYPARLADLAPKYLKSIPFDPCGGAANVPFVYRLTDGGRTYILYSRGPNLNDDGGKPLRSPTLDEPGDIVSGNMWPHTKARP